MAVDFRDHVTMRLIVNSMSEFLISLGWGDAAHGRKWDTKYLFMALFASVPIVHAVQLCPLNWKTRYCELVWLALSSRLAHSF